MHLRLAVEYWFDNNMSFEFKHKRKIQHLVHPTTSHYFSYNRRQVEEMEGEQFVLCTRLLKNSKKKNHNTMQQNIQPWATHQGRCRVHSLKSHYVLNFVPKYHYVYFLFFHTTIFSFFPLNATPLPRSSLCLLTPFQSDGNLLPIFIQSHLCLL